MCVGYNAAATRIARALVETMEVHDMIIRNGSSDLVSLETRHPVYGLSLRVVIVTMILLGFAE
jgi:hypothetical protein